jgi:hypothetical protein
MSERDEFTRRDKWVSAKRVGLRCSNPRCRKLTSGPTDGISAATNIGVAAHITAASIGGPRYAADFSREERTSIKNLIWLCQSCAKLVDDDPGYYTVDVLRDWKRQGEEAARQEVESNYSLFDPALSASFSGQYAHVLLPTVNAGVEYEGDGYRGSTVDYSVYPFVIEELISLGVARVAVVRGTDAENVLGALSKFMSSRITVINPSKQAEKIDALFRPLAAEFGVEFSWPGSPIFSLAVSSDRPINDTLHRAIDACMFLYAGIFNIVLGMEYELQIEVNLENAKKQIAVLLEGTKSREARDVLAILKGVLNCYHNASLSTIRPRVADVSQGQLLLRDLLSDSGFQKMEAAAHDFGVPEWVERAKLSFTQSAMRLLSKPEYKRRLRLATQKLNVPSRDTTKILSGAPFYQGYLPPVLPFDSVRRRAQESWLKVQPTPITPQHAFEPPRQGFDKRVIWTKRWFWD